MQWIMVILILIGDWLVIEKIRSGFYIWILVDGYFSFLNIYYKNYLQAIVFGLYAIMGIYGLYIWS